MSDSDAVRYWVNRDDDGTIYYEITDYVSRHFSKSIKLSDFDKCSFQINEPIINAENYIPVPGDNIVISNQDRTICYFYGFIVNDAPEHSRFDENLDNKFRYNLDCRQQGFNEYINQESIQDLVFQDDAFTVIMNQLMIASDESLGGVNFDKYQINFPDYDVKSANFKNLSLERAVKDFISEQQKFWNIEEYIEPDPVNGVKIERYLDIFDRRGIIPDDSSPWGPGINNESVRLGGIQTLANIENNINEYISAESNKLTKRKDYSKVINYLTLEGNVYDSDSITKLRRHTKNAQTGVFDYEFQIKCQNIPYIATQILADIDSADSAKIFYIHKENGVNVAEGNSVLVLPALQDDTAIIEIELSQVRSVEALEHVSIAGSLLTKITLDSNLSFTPESGDYFEVIGNHDIYNNNSPAESYEGKPGVVIDISQRGQGTTRLKFLPLSEPHSPQKIVFYSRDIRSYSQEFIFSQSKQQTKIGKAKAIKLPDNSVYSLQQIQDIADKFLVDAPNVEIPVETHRNFPKTGMRVTVDVSDFESDVFFIESGTINFTGGLNADNTPHFISQLNLNTLRLAPEDILSDIINPKDATPTRDPVKNFFSRENLKIVDYISYDIEQIPYAEFILFTNNADGKFNIYAIDLNSLSIFQITDASNSPGIDFYSPSINFDGTRIIAAGTAAAYYDIYSIEINYLNLSPATSTVTQITTTGYILDPIASKINNKIYFVQHNGTPAIYSISGYTVDSTRTKLNGTEPPYWGNLSPSLNNDETILYWETDWTAGSNILTELKAYRFSDGFTYTVLFGNTAVANAAVYRVSEHPTNGKLIMSNDMTGGDSIHDGWVNGELSSIDANTVGAFACSLKLAKGTQRKIMPCFSIDGLKVIFIQNTTGSQYDIMIADYNPDTDTISNVQVLLSDGNINYYPTWVKIDL